MNTRYFSIKTIHMYSWLQKKTENENFPNVNLVLSICQFCLLDKSCQIILKKSLNFGRNSNLPISRKKFSHYEKSK
jgi:hypothetical protein